MQDKDLSTPGGAWPTTLRSAALVRAARHATKPTSIPSDDRVGRGCRRIPRPVPDAPGHHHQTGNLSNITIIDW